MPHLTLEYTDNLAFDAQPLLARLHDEVVATGAVAMKGLKSRAVRHDVWRIADGHEDYAFVHLTVLLRQGRSLDVQKDIAERTMAVLDHAFGARREDGGHLSLSVDVREMRDRVAITNHNIPADGVATGEGTNP